MHLQAACLQLEDDVTPFRVHWPLAATLRINDTPVRLFERMHHVKLGVNQRDACADLSSVVSGAGRRQYY